jgi:hypothetical protein
LADAPEKPGNRLVDVSAGFSKAQLLLFSKLKHEGIFESAASSYTELP